MFATHRELTSDALGKGLVRAGLAVLEEMIPLSERGTAPGEARVRAWLDRGWSNDDAKAAENERPPSKSSWRDLALARLVYACLCFRNAGLGWHLEENRDYARAGVVAVADAVSYLARGRARRAAAERILRDHLSRPSAADLLV